MGEGAKPKKKSRFLFFLLGGCAAVAVIAAIVALVIFLYLKKKVSDIAANPAMAAAEMIINLSPDLEMVNKDLETNTITVKHRKSGETLTFSAEDIQQGKIKFSNDKGAELHLDLGKDGKGVSIEAKDASFTLGRDNDALPPDAIIYPGASARVVSRTATADKDTWVIEQFTNDSVPEAIAIFEALVKSSGYAILVIDRESGSIMSQHTKTKRIVAFKAWAEDGGTKIIISNS